MAPIIRAKWIMDGATTLTEAAQMVRAFADHLDEMSSIGWVLREEIRDDYGFLSWPYSRASRPAWYEGDPNPTEWSDGTPLTGPAPPAAV